MPDSITVAASKLDADPMNVRKSSSAGGARLPSPQIPFPPGVLAFKELVCSKVLQSSDSKAVS
ncbi:hypothetical protein CN151_16990 [Sinorhizobium meliloti]|uniref:hypothetical protein n=1 Tax=Rhizobium meliloti TaxID=382 RepID=UPI0002A59D93|nr:hypothetical protein [Sinorhizobium meliloti]AGA08730.1 hypothetical protein C770_GR4pB261 [Sinorhizobium meliloti GR4]RVL02571.1 hypothetical protein CN151_16990 [Sinorhizobium meliloti]RVM92100.1 hypothetical protein CN119_17865 [Sinorhizobium meliloti]RVN07383.1 hypothetical protein CN112_19215 [Sinorhizobium meliloti]